MMNQPNTPTPPSVRLLIGLRSPEPALLDELTGRLALEFGDVSQRSERWSEGETLRQWLAWPDPIDPAQLVKVKLHALRVEQLYLDPLARRRVRLDAAYLDPLRVVRATQHDAPHRLYLGSGLYGELFLRWQAPAGFNGFPWTQAEDLARPLLQFLTGVREEFIHLHQQAQANKG